MNKITWIDLYMYLNKIRPALGNRFIVNTTRNRGFNSFQELVDWFDSNDAESIISKGFLWDGDPQIDWRSISSSWHEHCEKIKKGKQESLINSFTNIHIL